MTDTAPKVTFEDIEASIASEFYFTAKDGVSGSTLGFSTGPKDLELITVCILLLKNGHRIVGVNEGPVSADNFDADYGKKLARARAIDSIWPLLGWSLREKLGNAN